jgi:polysaccharide pyruvyl transferase WcaK-like protein
MSEKEKSKIGLVTPYSGDNLGDGAIQEAVIENLRLRLPDADFCLFTLNPAKTEALHGTPSLPVYSDVSIYSDTIEQLPSSGASHGDRPGFLRNLSSRLKSYPVVLRLLRPFWLFAKGLLATPREVRHAVKMYFLLRDFELLIVSGGGQIDDYWGGEHPYALLKWGLLAKAAGVRFVFLSVGVCSLESRWSLLFAASALKLADYRSYRDLGSKKLLADLKFTHADRVMPDLAFSYPSTSLFADVVLPETDVSVFSRYAEALTLFIAGLLSKGHEVVLFATDAPDRSVIDLLMPRLEANASGDRPMKLRAAQVGCVRELLREVSGMDCVVASRLHGVILSHLSGKPVLAISYDRKVNQYMEDMEQGAYCLDIHGFQLDALEEAFDLLWTSQDAVKATILQKIQRYRKLLMSQYDVLVQGIQPEIHAPNLPLAIPMKEL